MPVVHHGLVHLVAVVDGHGAGRGHGPSQEPCSGAHGEGPLAAAPEEAARLVVAAAGVVPEG